jgi:hypothetical protein
LHAAEEDAEARQPMKSMGLIAWCFFAATAAYGATPKSSPLDALRIYAGTWKVEFTHLDTPFSKAGKESHTLKNDCWRSGEFYACNQFVDGESKALLVFTYNAKDKSYVSYPIVVGSDAAHAGKLTIKDDVWTFPWEASDKGKTTHFRVINTFKSAQAIDFRQEYSDDGEHWLLMASGHERRQK